MSLYDDVIAIDQKREELLQQVQEKLPALLAEQIRTLYPTANQVEIEYEAEASSDGVGLYYAYLCSIYDKDHSMLFDGNVYEIGLDEDNPAEQETIDIMPMLALGDWHLRYQFERGLRVIKFPPIEVTA